MPSVPCYCWLGGSSGIQPVKRKCWCAAGGVHSFLFLPTLAVMFRLSVSTVVNYKPHHSSTGTASEAHGQTPGWQRQFHTSQQLPDNKVFKTTIYCALQ